MGFISKKCLVQVAATHVSIDPPLKVEVERRDQSWAIAAWNIKIAGINHPLSQLLRLLTRISSRRGEVEVFETISPPDLTSFSPPGQFKVQVTGITGIPVPHPFQFHQIGLYPTCFSIIAKLKRLKVCRCYQPETEYSSALLDQLQSSDKSWLVCSLYE